MQLIKASLRSCATEIVHVNAEQLHAVRHNPEAELSVPIYDEHGHSIGFVPPNEILIEN
jgi:hypothetical protein